MRTFIDIAMGILVLGLAASAQGQQAAPAPNQQTVGFYPDPKVFQTLIVGSPVAADATPLTRQNLADFMNIESTKRPYPPQFSAQILGENGVALLITAHDDEIMSTEYRARAFMSRFSALTRSMPFFQQPGRNQFVTFPDLLHMMGFQALILSDGVEFTMQMAIVSPPKRNSPEVRDRE